MGGAKKDLLEETILLILLRFLNVVNENVVNCAKLMKHFTQADKNNHLPGFHKMKDDLYGQWH